jgi:hypothetical protein
MLDARAFTELAGGVFTHRRSWGRVSGAEKRALFWSFFDSPEAQGARATYSGARVTQLLRKRQYSVEHVVPRAVLSSMLRGAPSWVRNGACCNPINFAAELPRLNGARGELAFDLDGDPVAHPFARVREGQREVPIGIDAEGEWVPPRRSRGDIARTVLYMVLTYRLPVPLDARWLAWAQGDPPSNVERAFSDWTRRRWQIGNPLVEDTRVLRDLARSLDWS